MSSPKDRGLVEGAPSLALWWGGDLGPSRVSVSMHTYSNEDYRIWTPEVVVSYCEWSFGGLLAEDPGTRARERERWAHDTVQFEPGPYGNAPYALLAEKVDDGLGEPSTLLLMAGVGAERLFTLELRAEPSLSREQTDAALEFSRESERLGGEPCDQRREEAEASGGVAYRDFHATWYEAPKDPVHIHELTHQLFENRLFLGGGGSWFQEGVAEFMCTNKTERKAIKRLVKRERHVPFEEFLTLRSLLGGSKVRQDGSSGADEAYLQAACLIEFVSASRATKGKLQDFIHAAGKTPYNDLAAIERALESSLGMSIAEFEEAFVAYWKKR